MKNYFVYILECSDSTYYTGITNNLSRRLSEHKFGNNKTSYTHKRRPIEIVYYSEFTDVNIAIEFEKKIKKWSKIKKIALITGNYNSLKKFSKKKFI